MSNVPFDLNALTVMAEQDYLWRQQMLNESPYRFQPPPMAPPAPPVRFPYDNNPLGDGFLGMAYSMGGPLLAQAMGYEVTGLTNRNYNSILQNFEQYRGQQQNHALMAARDRPAFDALHRGVYRLGGWQYDDKARQNADNVFPYAEFLWSNMAYFAPELADSLGGRYGSAVVFDNNMSQFTRSMLDASTGKLLDFETQGALKAELHRQLYSPENVKNRLLRAGDLAGGLAVLGRQGMFGGLTATEADLQTPQGSAVFAKKLAELTQAVNKKSPDFSEQETRDNFREAYQLMRQAEIGRLTPNQEQRLNELLPQFDLLQGYAGAGKDAQKRIDLFYDNLQSNKDHPAWRDPGLFTDIVNFLEDKAFGTDHFSGDVIANQRFRREMKENADRMHKSARFADVTQNWDAEAKEAYDRLLKEPQFELAMEKLTNRISKAKNDKEVADAFEEFKTDHPEWESDVEAIQKPFIKQILGTMTGQNIAEKAKAWEPALKAAKELMGEMGMGNASAGEAAQIMSNIFGGNVNHLDPKKVERDMRLIKETARLTGRGLQDIVQEVATLSQTLRSKGVSSHASAKIVMDAAATEAAFRTQGTFQHELALTPGELAQLSEQLAVAGATSEMANMHGALLRLQETSGEQFKGTTSERILQAITNGQEYATGANGEQINVRHLTRDQIAGYMVQDQLSASNSATLLVNNERSNMYASSQTGIDFSPYQNREVGERAYLEGGGAAAIAELAKELSPEQYEALLQNTTQAKGFLLGLVEGAKSKEDGIKSIADKTNVDPKMAARIWNIIEDSFSGTGTEAMTAIDLNNKALHDTRMKISGETAIQAARSKALAGISDENAVAALSRAIQESDPETPGLDVFMSFFGAQKNLNMTDSTKETLQRTAKVEDRFREQKAKVEKLKSNGAPVYDIEEAEKEANALEEEVTKAWAEVTPALQMNLDNAKRVKSHNRSQFDADIEAFFDPVNRKSDNKDFGKIFNTKDMKTVATSLGLDINSIDDKKKWGDKEKEKFKEAFWEQKKDKYYTRGALTDDEIKANVELFKQYDERLTDADRQYLMDRYGAVSEPQIQSFLIDQNDPNAPEKKVDTQAWRDNQIAADKKEKAEEEKKRQEQAQQKIRADRDTQLNERMVVQYGAEQYRKQHGGKLFATAGRRFDAAEYLKTHGKGSVEWEIARSEIEFEKNHGDIEALESRHGMKGQTQGLNNGSGSLILQIASLNLNGQEFRNVTGDTQYTSNGHYGSVT